MSALLLGSGWCWDVETFQISIWWFLPLYFYWKGEWPRKQTLLHILLYLRLVVGISQMDEPRGRALDTSKKKNGDHSFLSGCFDSQNWPYTNGHNSLRHDIDKISNQNSEVEFRLSTAFTQMWTPCQTYSNKWKLYRREWKMLKTVIEETTFVY